MKLPKTRKVAILTLGCKTNQYESDAILTQFTGAGYRVVPFNEPADVYLVNTCVVTAEADRKSRQMLRRARGISPGALVVSIGCQPSIEADDGVADLSIDNRHKRDVLEQVEETLRQRAEAAPAGCGDVAPDDLRAAASPRSQGHPGAERSLAEQSFDEFGAIVNQSETRALIKIEDGCDQRCAYCLIAKARGPVRSRDPRRILEEARALAAAGYREAVLTGIHIGSYDDGSGRGGPSLANLIRSLATVEGFDRIRLGSLEPAVVTADFIQAIRSVEKLCPHFHLSLQSGSDAVLRRMRRGYTSAAFKRTIERLRDAFPDPGLTTDVIVGFPGESESEFRQSVDFCRDSAFSRIHVFPYSARQGTEAAAMPDQVPSTIRHDRAALLRSVGEQSARRFHTRRIGRCLDFLVEKRENDHWSGYSSDYVPLRVPAGSGQPDPCVPGRILLVIGVESHADFLLARTCPPCDS